MPRSPRLVFLQVALRNRRKLGVRRNPRAGQRLPSGSVVFYPTFRPSQAPHLIRRNVVSSSYIRLTYFNQLFLCSNWICTPVALEPVVPAHALFVSTPTIQGSWIVSATKAGPPPHLSTPNVLLVALGTQI